MTRHPDAHAIPRDSELAELRRQRGELTSATSAFNEAINFAIGQGLEAANSLDAWRHGDTAEWPEFSGALPAAPGSPPASTGWTDADADAARLALELECLLTDKDLPVVSVSRWWDSAHEALDLHRQRIAAVPGHPAQQANPKALMRLTDDDIDKINRRTQMPDGSLSGIGDRQWLEMFRIVARSVEADFLRRLTDTETARNERLQQTVDGRDSYSIAAAARPAERPPGR